MRISFWLCAVVMVGVIAVGCEIGGDGDDECLTSTPCVDNSDCDSGQHCNTALATPMCQVLYCGEAGTQCSEDELCLARVCDGDLCAEPECVPDCGSAECGLDPVCGTQNCGTCGDGETCQSGQCKTGTGWEPDDYTISCSDGMCLIPEGPFWMGCNEEVDKQCETDELPYHQVHLSPFYIDLTEVTQTDYDKCVSAGGCSIPSKEETDCNWDPVNKGQHPAICVTWEQAVGYCAWAGKRLPTEAEWEKAARGTDGRKYPWGNETATCEYAVTYENGSGCGTHETWAVCSKSPMGNSPYGLCDMAGNANEWVSDLYAEDYYATSPSSNPSGPHDGGPHVFRSSSYSLGPEYARVARRTWDKYYNDGFGFRCAKDAP